MGCQFQAWRQSMGVWHQTEDIAFRGTALGFKGCET